MYTKSVLVWAVLTVPNAWSLGLNVGSNGVSGLHVFPMATIPNGSLLYNYSNKVIDHSKSEGYNQSLVVGLNSFSEIGLRIADTTVARDMWATPGGIRDLSASGKVQINPLLGVDSWPLKMAVGVTDYGGAATNFRSYYGVATYGQKNWVSSIGYALSRNNVNNPLHGAFGSAALQIAPWASLSVESNQAKSWAGLTLRNENLLAKLNAPLGASVSLSFNKQIRGPQPSQASNWIGLALNLPLDWSVGRSPAPSSSSNSVKPVVPSNFEAFNPTEPTARLPDSQPGPSHADAVSLNLVEQQNLAIDELAKSMADHGFEGIDIGQSGDVLVVKFSDFTYEHSLLDGAGVALGLISKLKKHFNHYHIIQARWGTPSVGYQGQLQCLSLWLNQEACDQETAVKPFFRNKPAATNGVAWRIKNHNPYQYKLRLRLAPAYNYYVATEYSMLDYSIGVNVNPMIHLWDGGAVEFLQIRHLNSSQEFEKGGFYNYSRIKNQNKRLLLHHMQRHNHGFSSRFSAGQLNDGQLLGGQAEFRWDSLSGQWASGINLSNWKAKNNHVGLPSGSPKTAFVRYAPTGADWRLELIAGEYWFKDKGLTALSTHWFGDVQFNYYIRHSLPPEQFWPGKRSVTLAGIELNFPLTPRKAMPADRGFQIKGSPRFAVGLITPIGRPDNYIVGSNGVPIYEKALVATPIPSYAGGVLLDFDRANPSYFDGKLDRLRYAYRRWVLNEYRK